MGRDKSIEDMRINERWKIRAQKAEAQVDAVQKVMKEISVWKCGHCTSAPEILDKLIAATLPEMMR